MIEDAKKEEAESGAAVDPPKLSHLGLPGDSGDKDGSQSPSDKSLSPASMERQSSFLQRSRTGWYQPQAPLGISFFEQTFHLGTTFGVSVDMHITLLYYICIEIIWAFCHYKEPLYWFAYVLIVLFFQFIALYFHMIGTLWCATYVKASIYRVIIWPYGTMGYSTSYTKWRLLLATLYMGPFIHTLFVIISVSLNQIANTNTQWRFEEPMKDNFLQNVINGTWVANSVILVLHICVPIYSFKAGRLAASLLYRTRKVKSIADILFWPMTFMAFIALIFGIVDLRPLSIFAAIWGAYQTYLIWKAKRLDMFDRLPMFNSLEPQLRSQNTLRRMMKAKMKREEMERQERENENENEKENDNHMDNNGSNDGNDNSNENEEKNESGQKGDNNNDNHNKDDGTPNTSNEKKTLSIQVTQVSVAESHVTSDSENSTNKQEMDKEIEMQNVENE